MGVVLDQMHFDTGYQPSFVPSTYMRFSSANVRLLSLVRQTGLLILLVRTYRSLDFSSLSSLRTKFCIYSYKPRKMSMSTFWRSSRQKRSSALRSLQEQSCIPMTSQKSLSRLATSVGLLDAIDRYRDSRGNLETMVVGAFHKQSSGDAQFVWVSLPPTGATTAQSPSRNSSLSSVSNERARHGCSTD